MNPIAYFKLQAKNLLKDYKTKIHYVDNVDGALYYQYSPKYFDIDSIFIDFDVDEEKFSLMTAQHIIAVMVGFRNWSELLNATAAELELAKLLFDNQNKIHLEEWEMYISGVEETFPPELCNSETRLEIFKTVFLNVAGPQSKFPDYCLKGRNAN